MLTVVQGTAPAAPSTPAEQLLDELAAIEAERKTLAARKLAADARRIAAAGDPARKLAEAKLAATREKLAAEVAEHEVEADRIYLEACVKYGEDQVVRIRTPLGSIVMRAQTELEADAEDGRVKAHLRAAREADAKDAKEAAANSRVAAETATRIELGKLVLTTAAHFDRVMGKFYLLWATVSDAKRSLSDARIAAEGKGGAA